MAGVAELLGGLLTIVAGTVWILDVGDVGTRFYSFSTCLNAAPWKRSERPDLDEVRQRHGLTSPAASRIVFGAFVMFVGFVLSAAGLSSLLA